MKNYREQLIELLKIEAPSGEEHKVRAYLEPHLIELVDTMFVDEAGNLLAEKKVGDGVGATVMLSAHMDSVRNIVKGRKIIEKDGVLTASKGVLGADDRAGIAIIMSVLRNIEKIDFSGNIKIAFTVSEEIGCVGSSAMDANWYKDVNLAVVVDRRGNRDIVTGCGSPWNFCSEAVGKFLEDCSGLQGMDWKAVGGGVSDAMTFSSNGVHSVNLSAGYRNEHTEKEYMVIKDGQDTINLMLQAFALINGFYTTFGEVPKGYSRNEWYGSSSTASYWNDLDYSTGETKWHEETIWEQDENRFGNVSLTDMGGYMSIFQQGNDTYGNQEIWMESSEFSEMVDAYLSKQGLPTVKAMKQMKARMDRDAKKAVTSKKPRAKKANGLEKAINKAVGGNKSQESKQLVAVK
jgi:hypothetical protein